MGKRKIEAGQNEEPKEKKQRVKLNETVEKPEIKKRGRPKKIKVEENN